MKLFAWQPPDGHYGYESLFVMAETEVEARVAVDELFNRDALVFGKKHWERGEYRLTVAERGKVITNENG
jgi:hypothetical protein